MDVKTLLVSIVTTLGLIVTCAVYAQAPADAPAGTTGQCKDGTWSSAASKKGACHGHQGVKQWYGSADASTSDTSATKSTAKTTSTTPAAKTTTTSSKDTHAASTTSTAATGTPPAGATGLCNDGTYYSGASKKGACHGHKGVKTWYGGAADSSKTTTTSASPSATPAPATMPAQTFPKSTPTTMPNAQTPTTGTQTGSHPTMPGGTSTTAAAGGGAGKVWVNTSSKVYHCQDDRYYGKTKEGEYMTEADAIAKGNRAARGKSCSS